MARKIISAFILTLLVGILGFSIYMMIKYYKKSVLEEEQHQQQQQEQQKQQKTDTEKQAENPGSVSTQPTAKPSLVSPTPTPTPTPVPVKDYTKSFKIERLSDEVLSRIMGKSYPEDATISIDDLRIVHVAHYGFDGEIHEGELIVNKAIEKDVKEIFKELFDIKYPIEKIRLIDEYDAVDEASMEDNNTSAFCYRTIAETDKLSNHALGLAIDINPLYNPYVYTRSDGTLFLQPENAEEYVDRDTDNPYYIRRDDECYNIFISHGFTWGGDWSKKKDYQHFEKAIE